MRKATNAAQLLGHRPSSGELLTADLSVSAACHQLLLLSDATDGPEVLELLEQDDEELCRALQRQYLIPVERALRPWTNARLQLRP